jgi:SAM-dependent methyltransferase
VLTVDFARLGLRAGDRLLDLGCGGGRHAFEAHRRGAHTVAFDRNGGDVKDAAAMLAAMRLEGEAPADALGAAINGDALNLPFAAGAFDRVIAAEVLEHVVDHGAAMAELGRVLRPGGTLAVTVPRWFPERVCWALAEEYHAPRVPDGHVRIYRRSPTGSHHAHALHTPYWWLKCTLGLGRPDRWPVRTYQRFLLWDITRRPLVTRALDRALNPVLGKSLVLYAVKP